MEHKTKAKCLHVNVIHFLFSLGKSAGFFCDTHWIKREQGSGSFQAVSCHFELSQRMNWEGSNNIYQVSATPQISFVSKSWRRETTYCSEPETLQKVHADSWRSYKKKIEWFSVKYVWFPHGVWELKRLKKVPQAETLTTCRGPASSLPRKRGTCCNFWFHTPGKHTDIRLCCEVRGILLFTDLPH